MEKFLSIPVTGQANQLVSANNVILVDTGANSPTSTVTLIKYTGGKVVTLGHTAQVASDMRIAIEKAIVEALMTPWTKVVYNFVSPRAVSDIYAE